jgi:ankyrin repeat protein
VKFPNLIEKIFRKKEDIDREKAHDEISFLDAIQKGDLNKVSRLIKAGANIHATYEESKYEYDGPISALSLACLHGHIDIVKLLLKKGAEGLGDPLTFAAKGGSVEVLKLLVRNGYKVHPISPRPRWIAAENGHLEALKFLVSKGDTLNDFNLLKHAGFSRNRELFDYVLSNGNFLKRDPNPILAAFAALDDPKGIEAMIKAGADVHYIEDALSYEYAEEPLRCAARKENVKSIKTLLKHYSEERLEILKCMDHSQTFGGKVVGNLVTEECQRRKRAKLYTKVNKKIKDQLKNEQDLSI